MLWWPIIIMVAFYGAGLFTDLRIMFYLENPDDSKHTQGLVGKVVVLVGLQMTWLLISGTPTDAFDAYMDGGMDMYIFWSVCFLFTVLYLVIPLPFAIFMYEADSDPRVSKTPGWKRGLCMMGIVIMVAAVVIGVGFAIIAKATFPIDVRVCDGLIASYEIDENGQRVVLLPEEASCFAEDSVRLNSQVTFFVFLACLTAFIGYWLFTLFAGIGLIAVPFDLIIGYIDRARPMDLDKFKELKRKLGERAAALKVAGVTIRQTELALRDASGCGIWRHKFRLRAEIKKFRQAVYLLESELEWLSVSFHRRGENPAWTYTKLAFGITSAILSLIWFLHIIMYAGVGYFIEGIPGIWNQMMIGIRKSGVYFLDLIFFAVLVLYVLFAVVKGCFKLGMRIFWGYPIHPVKKGATRQSSLLFNTAMIVLASCALIQFSYQCFRDYARGSALEFIFGVQGSNMTLLGAFYNNAIFTWLLCVVMLATTIWLSVKPRDYPAITQDYKFTTPVGVRPAAPEPQPDQAPGQAVPDGGGENQQAAAQLP